MTLRSDHPYLQRREEPTWKKQERRLAKELGGRTTPGSGATPLPGNKGDVQSPEFLVEAKCTSKESYRVKYADLFKLVKLSRAVQKIPVLHLLFRRESVEVDEESEWVVIPHRVFKELVRASKR